MGLDRLRTARDVICSSGNGAQGGGLLGQPTTHNHTGRSPFTVTRVPARVCGQ